MKEVTDFMKPVVLILFKVSYPRACMDLSLRAFSFSARARIRPSLPRRNRGQRGALCVDERWRALEHLSTLARLSARVCARALC